MHARLLGTDSAPMLLNFAPSSSPSPGLLSDLMLLLVGGVRGVVYNGTDLIGYYTGPLYLQAW